MYDYDYNERQINRDFCAANNIEINDDLLRRIEEAVSANLLRALRCPNLRFVLWLDEDGDLNTFEDFAGGNSVPVMLWEGRGITIDEQCYQYYSVMDEFVHDDPDIMLAELRKLVEDKARFGAILDEYDDWDRWDELRRAFPGAWDELDDNCNVQFANDHRIECDDDLIVTLEYNP